MELKFKERITFLETIQMINEVSDSVFDTDNETNNTSYIPELYDYAFGLAYAKYYGEYVSKGNSEDDYNIALDCLEKIRNTSNTQLIGIKNSINEKINLNKSKIIKSDINIVSKFDELAKPIIEFIYIMSKKLSSVDTEKLNEQLNKLNVKNLIDGYFNKTHAENKK